MGKCPLCDVFQEQYDYREGRINIQCPKCGGYKTHDKAIKHLIGMDFGNNRRKEFQRTIQELNKMKEKAEIVVIEKDGKEILSAKKIALD